MPSQKKLPEDLLTSFASAPTEEDRKKLLEAEKLLANPQTVQALCDQANHWARQDLALARKAASSALWLAEFLTNRPCKGLAHRTLANVLAALGHPAEAHEHYSAALDVFDSLDEPLEAAITRSSALQTITDTRGIETAFNWASQARATFEDNEDHLRLARLENNLAILFFRQEDYTRAQKHWQVAHNTLREIGETLDEATTLQNLAVCAISLNHPDKAKTYYRQARSLSEQNGFTFLLHRIDYNIAYLHHLEGDHHRALQLYQEARQRSQRLGDTYHEAYCSLDETEVYLELNLLDEAATVAQLAATQFQEQERPYESAKALYNLALIKSLQGEPRQALSHLHTASKAIEGQGNILWPGQLELLRASIFASEGRHFEARRSAERSLDLFRESDLPRKAALSQLLLARVHLAQQAHIEAEKACRAALELCGSFAEPVSLFQTYYLLGLVLEERGDRTGAVTALQTAEGHLLELRQRRAALQMPISIVAAQPLDLYADLVALLIGDDDCATLTPELFRVLQTAKARSLADPSLVAFIPARAKTTMRSQLVDQVSQLRKELNWLYRRIDRSELPDSPPSTSVIRDLQSQSRSKEIELAKALSRLRTRNPHTDVDPERIGISGIEGVQGVLRDQAFLEYFVAHDIIIALAISRTRSVVAPVAVTSTVRDLQRRLWYYFNQAAASRRAASSGSKASPQRILSELYRELLLPLKTFVKDSPLIIAPHDFLYLVPFQALQAEDKHLIELTEVAYVPSATDLLRVSEATQDKRLGFAEVNTLEAAKSDTVFPKSVSTVARFDLSPPGRTSRGVQDLLSEQRAGLHLIAGASLRDDNPLFSALDMGAEKLSVLDLYRSKLRTSVLTIEGRGFSPSSPKGHQGISALWRGLLTAGTSCAFVPTDLSYRDAQREHARIVYDEMLRGCPSGLAHRRAILRLKARGSPVQDWSGIGLVGCPWVTLDLASSSIEDSA